MKVAVIGSGISGLVAAHALHEHHDVTVFEAAPRLGGHAHTVDVDIDGVNVAVDTGFIVYNEANYPRFTALLRDLRVETQPSDMSFAVSDPTTNLEYRCSTPNTIFAQRRNLTRGRFLGLLGDIVRFSRAARRLLDDHERSPEQRLPDPHRAVDASDLESLDDFVRRLHLSDEFVRSFLVPFGASLWSADPDTFMEMPATCCAGFLATHGLLAFTHRPAWRTVSGGSRRYVDAIVAPWSGRIRLSTAVHKITSVPGAEGATEMEVELLTDDGPALFDRVVVAAHSDDALAMLGAPTRVERDVLGAIRYQSNSATLHTDPSVMPRQRRAWASWNYAVRPGSRRSTVTYWMNNLQSLSTSRPLLLSLNREDDIADAARIASFEYRHPVFGAAAVAAQRRRHAIQGRNGIYYAGAYWGYGFHEDGVQSALEVARMIGEETS